MPEHNGDALQQINTTLPPMVQSVAHAYGHTGSLIFTYNANSINKPIKKKYFCLNFCSVKETIWAHHQATGEWLSVSKKGADGKSYRLEHGPCAGESVTALNSALRQELRGLSGESSIKKLNDELKRQQEENPDSMPQEIPSVE